MCWCVGVTVGSKSFICSGRSLSCLTWQKRISGPASVAVWLKEELRALQSKIDLWEFVKTCGLKKEALFLQGGGFYLHMQCHHSDGISYCHFCLSVNKTWNWLHTPSPHESLSIQSERRRRRNGLCELHSKCNIAVSNWIIACQTYSIWASCNFEVGS